jgi:hypothetical protein
MSQLASEQDALLRALARHGVELVVVGGVAAQLNGWRGATVDLDIAVSIEAANVERLNAALASVDAAPGVPGALGTVFATVHGRLEIVRRADGIGDYAAWFRRARPRDIGEGITVIVADPDDVLRSKEAAGRDKDRAALPQMRRDFIEAGALALDAARGPVAAVRAAAAGAPAFLAAVLGDRPPEPSAARLWDGVAQLVLDYRSRWGITDPLSALGPDAHDGRQAKDRAQLEKALARAHRLLRRRA